MSSKSLMAQIETLEEEIEECPVDELLAKQAALIALLERWRAHAEGRRS